MSNIRRAILLIAVFTGYTVSSFAATPIWEQSSRSAGREALTIGNQPLVSFAPLVKKVAPAIVNIASQGEKGATRSLGSGFIINNAGYIVTSDAIVQDLKRVEVTLTDGRTFVSSVVGVDRKAGVALLKVVDGKDLPTLPFGNLDTLAIGDFVVALGSPVKLRTTANAGIVSDIARSEPNESGMSFIQTDAYMGPGNAGGPLCNLEGEVVGVNALSVRGERISFGVPINMVKSAILGILSKR